MRPGQSNKRSRGRGRKGPSPLSRSYESNGPDVKIRGTAQHVADKYINLARDAQSSGDTVLSEAYYQHAEHYYRIVAAAQQQMNQPVNVRRADDPIDTSEGDEEEEREAFDPSDPDAPQPDLRGQNNNRQNNNQNGMRSDDDGERRGRRGRSRGRRGRDDFRSDEAPNPVVAEGESGSAEGANGHQPDETEVAALPSEAAAAHVNGDAESEQAPKPTRSRRKSIDVSDKFAADEPGETPPTPPAAEVASSEEPAPVQAAPDES